MNAEDDTREGGDIFAADMQQQELVSRIAQSFENTTVFLTGGTGLIGKLFLEKLLRTCKTVKVLILVRPKKNKEALTIFQEIFEGPNMVPLEIANPRFPQQIRLVKGDCAKEDLGLGQDDKQMLINEVNYIINCAATSMLDEDLKNAAFVNVRAVKYLIAMAKRMKNLRAFLQISTAYAHCNQKVIDEAFYEVGTKADDLLQMFESLDSDRLKTITPGLIKDWPNIFTFTKAIAENLIQTNGANLPIAILRPSIVISSQTEPVAGWIDNCHGISGIFMAAGLGLLRVLQGKKNKKTDMIPADYVSNAGLAIMWETAERRSLNDNMEIIEETTEEIPIYNAVSSAESPITFGEFQKLFSREGRKNPTQFQLWYPMLFIISNSYISAILAIFLHTIPACLVDGLCFCLGKERRMMNSYRKINELSNGYTYFMTREWKFCNKNLQALWLELEPADKVLFPFSMKSFNWKNFIYFYVRGIRVYLLKDPQETIPMAKKKFRMLTLLHYFVITLLVVCNLSVIHYLIK